MFRNVARFKQALGDAACEHILKTALRGVLSVQGDDGYPYGMPLNHWYDPAKRTLYFHSGKHGHRADALAKCDKVSYCVLSDGEPIPGHWALRFSCVIAFGRMRPVTDEAEAMNICRALSHKFTADDAYIEDEITRLHANTVVYALSIEHLTGKTVKES